MVHRSVVIAAAAACSIAFGAATARAADGEPTTKELLEQIKQLQSKVERLEAKQDQASADVAATVDQILRDAERRSALLQTDGAVLAGWEKGKFFLRSADNSFLLNPAVQLQVRYVVNSTSDAEDADGGADDRTESGLEIRRMKFSLGGHAFTPKLVYQFQWEANQNGGEVTLEDAWLRYQLQKEWFVRGGQFKDPTFHEERTSSRRQLAVDRSLLNEEIAGGETDYIQAVSVIYDPGQGTPFRAEVGLSDGVGSLNTNWRDYPVNDANFGVVGRVDYFVHGDRKSYEDFTALDNKESLLAVGAGAHWQQAGDANTVYHSVDVQFENTTGLSVFGAYVGRFNEEADDDAYDFGFLGQVGYLLNRRWEVFGRYDVLFTDDEVAFAGGGEDTFHEFTVGANYYLRSHAAKFTLDLTYLPNGSPSNHAGIGVLSTGEDEFVLRGQFQLLL